MHGIYNEYIQYEYILQHERFLQKKTKLTVTANSYLEIHYSVMVKLHHELTKARR